MRKSRAIPEINAGSMADIAFLLLIFFLVTTTMDTDTGIAISLPPKLDEKMPEPPQIPERNVLKVLVNSNNQLLVEGELTDISSLREKTVKFINNNGTDPNLSDNPQKAVISLKADRGTQYETYINIQNELKAAYREIRDEEAMKRFGRKYSELRDDQRDIIKKEYPQKISEAEPEDIGGAN